MCLSHKRVYGLILEMAQTHTVEMPERMRLRHPRGPTEMSGPCPIYYCLVTSFWFNESHLVA